MTIREPKVKLCPVKQIGIVVKDMDKAINYPNKPPGYFTPTNI